MQKSAGPFIGMIGCGRMGRPIVNNLLAAGRHVAVFDTNSATLTGLDPAVVVVCASPAEVADRAPIVLACVPTVDAFNDCTIGPRGIIHGKTIRIYMHQGTTGPRNVTAIAHELGERGIATLDAPISGGPARAIDGTLATMVSGPTAAIDEAIDVIELFSSSITRFGEAPGAAQAAKLINNMLSAANLATAIEGLIVAAKAGVDIAALSDLITHSTGGSYAFATKIKEQVLTRKFDFGGALRIIRKDMESWREMADDLDARCVISRTVYDTYMRAIATLAPDDDMTAITRLFEAEEGVTIPVIAPKS